MHYQSFSSWNYFFLTREYISTCLFPLKHVFDTSGNEEKVSHPAVQSGVLEGLKKTKPKLAVEAGSCSTWNAECSRMPASLKRPPKLLRYAWYILQNVLSLPCRATAQLECLNWLKNMNSWFNKGKHLPSTKEPELYGKLLSLNKYSHSWELPCVFIQVTFVMY